MAIKSAKIPVLPFYAYTGCDYGPQTISEPNNGHAASSVLLSHPSETNAATLTAVTPNTVTPNDTTTSLVITGTNLSGVTQVGFFESGNGSAGPEPVTVNVTGATNTQVNVSAPLPSRGDQRAERLVRAGQDRCQLVRSHDRQRLQRGVGRPHVHRRQCPADLRTGLQQR